MFRSLYFRGFSLTIGSHMIPSFGKKTTYPLLLLSLGVVAFPSSLNSYDWVPVVKKKLSFKFIRSVVFISKISHETY